MFKPEIKIYSGITNLDQLRGLLVERDATIAKLRELLFPKPKWNPNWTFSRLEEAVLSILLRASPLPISAEDIIAQLALNQEELIKRRSLVDIIIRIRRKIHPIAINSIPMRGYYMTEVNARRIHSSSQLELL